MEETKPFEIAKQAVKIAFERVKANKGTYGIDEQSISDFELDLKKIPRDRWALLGWKSLSVQISLR